MYDIFRDEVIVDLNDENFSKFYVQINKEKVDSFSIRFNDKIYNLSNVKNANGIEDGFYEIPHHGKLQLFIKHLVHKQNDHVMITYTYKQVLWLKRENHFYDISSKKKFIRQFPNHKKSVRRKIRLLKINFDFPNRLKLVKLLQHAESL
ncbi:hypothetical protein [Marinifilum caeruleilacunae]|uniref:Uncharacterized protein n=1 Tax=Marinifilum caeruleilacunae TaxID=2499076 RepID=A0ABX1WVW5_9BACT|nr:hypothetical protein [Marinifilum caeruleilacunae]NOU60268.1 hypothetical protein [Marinifilum caeruleilacunae]